jgi:hypothetical protein
MYVVQRLLALCAATLTLARATLSGVAANDVSNVLRGTVGGTQAVHGKYTRNAACIPNFCINPIIPGLMFLGESVLEKNKEKSWVCADVSNTHSLYRFGGFCSRVIASYPFSIPKPDAAAVTAVNTGATTKESPDSHPGLGDNSSEAGMIQQQTYKALQTYIGHLSGMGYDFWDFTSPWDHEDECIQSIWKMSCYTHFPRCNEINVGEYLPPCRTSCQNYLKKCKVDCCDEGTQCVFTHERQLANGSMVTEHGYADYAGPHPLCTGGSGSHALSAGAAVFLTLMVAILH